MNSKILEMYLSDFPDLKDEYDKLIDRGYQPYKCEVNESFIQDTLNVELKVLLKDFIGKKICISHQKPVNEEEKFYTTNKDFTSNLNKMIHPKVKLSKLEVLNKDFKKSFIGYNCDEVDSFLDIIIKDYDEFNKILNIE
jgi:DivIVA domain-containing protein